MTLTIAEAASHLHCSRSHLSRAIHGRLRNVPPLPSLRVGRRVLIRQQMFAEWLRSLEDRQIDEMRMEGTYFDWESIGGA